MLNFKIFTKLFIAIVLIGTFACKKEKSNPDTGTLKIRFVSAQPGTADSIRVHFAEDMLKLKQDQFIFGCFSLHPHPEITLSNIKPLNWYYKTSAYTSGALNSFQENVVIEAGKTSEITIRY